ncbi:MAG: aldo/keto reductase [Candidatus Marinimicrobia bacterium]|nr:aldo/keto reductase [Candidatus Neomarinimicrobiota bacterium]
MEYRRLGHSGLKLSTLSFGSWVTFKAQVDVSLAEKMMKTAYDAGVNFFDNAEVYADGASEQIMGSALKKLAWSRDSYAVSSKAFWGGQLPTQRGLSRKHLTDACHAALNRLQVDYLDLFFCHRPDESTPIEETVRAMNDLITQGKILYWGTSEWTAQQIMEAYGLARQYGLVPPTMEQPEYNMFRRDKVESDFRRLYTEIGLGTTIWSPLASGLLTGKYSNGVPADARVNLPGYGWLKRKFESPEGQESIKKAVELQKIAADIGHSLTNMSIAWCAANPNVSTVILGASKLSQLEENLQALDAVPALTAEIMEKIETILQNKPTPPPQF